MPQDHRSQTLRTLLIGSRIDRVHFCSLVLLLMSIVIVSMCSFFSGFTIIRPLAPKSGCKVNTVFVTMQIFAAFLTAFNFCRFPLFFSLSRRGCRCNRSSSKASAKLDTFSFPSKLFPLFLCFKTCFSNTITTSNPIHKSFSRSIFFHIFLTTNRVVTTTAPNQRPTHWQKQQKQNQFVCISRNE